MRIPGERNIHTPTELWHFFINFDTVELGSDGPGLLRVVATLPFTRRSTPYNRSVSSSLISSGAFFFGSPIQRDAVT